LHTVILLRITEFTCKPQRNKVKNSQHYS